MRELAKIEIDNHTYEFSQFTTTESLRTLTKLTKILGEPMILAISSIFKGSKEKLTAEDVKRSLLDREINTDVLAQAVRVLMEKMDEDEVIGLVKKLVTDRTSCDMKPINFDTHFMGELGHLVKVVKAALVVQYGNFFDAILSQLPVKKTEEKPAQTPIRAM